MKKFIFGILFAIAFSSFAGVIPTNFQKGVSSDVRNEISTIIADSAHNYYDTASVNWLLDSLDSAILDTVSQFGCQCDFSDTTYRIVTNYLDQDSFQVCSLSTGKGFVTEFWIYNDSIADINCSVSVEILANYPYTTNNYQTVTVPIPITLNNSTYHSSLNDTIIYTSVQLTGANIIIREDSDSIYHRKSNTGTTAILYEALVNTKTSGSPIFEIAAYTSSNINIPIYNNKIYLKITNTTTSARDYILNVRVRRIR